MMIDELQTMAADPQAPAKRHIWQARLHHRVMKLVHWTGRAGEPTASVSDASLAVLDIGNAILALRQLAESPAISSRKIKAIRATLRRIGDIRNKPDATARSLTRLAWLLRAEYRSVADQADLAAQSLLANLAFFRGRTPTAEGARHRQAPLQNG